MKSARIVFFACGLLVLSGSWSRANAAIGQLWAKHEGSASYFSEMDHCVAIVSDAQGNVYTAGTARDTVRDTLCYVTTKYNQWGRILWRSLDTYPQCFNSPFDTYPPLPQLVLDTSGNLYLAATEMLYSGGQRWNTHGIHIIKFNGSTGSEFWNLPYMFGGPTGYFHDVYLSGIVYDSVYRSLFLASTEYLYHSDVGSNYDFGIEKINPTDGSVVWDSAYHQLNGVANAQDITTGICLSAITRDPVVTGYCMNDDTLYNWVTVDFNRTTGARTWARPWRRDSATDNEMPWAVTSDSTGIYVAGGIWQDNESQYGWALLKLQLNGSIVNADTDYVNENTYFDNWLASVKTTVGSQGRAYAAGWVDANNTNSLDWLVLGDSSGPRQTSLLRHSWRTTKDDGNGNDDQATAVVLDNQDRPWVMGYFDDDTVYDWGVSRFADNGTSSPNLLYHRNNNWDDMTTPTALAIRDTNHIYVGGFTLNDSSDENHTVVRFGANIPSAALDSFRDSTFAWRDTVDSGATVRVNAFYHNTGYSLAMPKIKASLSPFYADSSVDTVGAPPESSRAVLMTHRWTAGARGPGVMKCTLAMAGDTSAANNLRTRNVFVRVGDVAPDSLGVADTVDEGVAFTPAARVCNYGNTTVSFPIAFQVGDTIKTFTVTALPPDSIRRITFPSFTMPRGKYRVRTYTQLSSDLRRSNDTLNRSDSIFVRYRDIACRSILAPVGSYVESVSVTPRATFKNMGNVTTTFRADFVIPPPSDQAQLPVFGVQPLFPDLLPRSLAPLLPAPQFSPKLFSSTPHLAPVLSGSAKNPGTLKSVVRSPQSSIPASPQPPAFSSRLAPLLPHSLAPYSAVRTPRSALGTDGTYHDSILSITLAAGDSSIRSFTSWLATPTGSYQARAYSVYALDQLHSNDTVYQAFTVARHDVACTHLLAPTGGVDSNSAVTPACSLYNYGSGAENYLVRMRIDSFYNQTASVTSHASGTRIYVTFPAWSVQQARGSYQVRCTTELTTDANHANDRQTGTVQVNVHDVACSHLLAPTGGVDSNSAVTPACSLYNYGSGAENYSVRMRIGAFYNQTASVTSHASGSRIYVTFPAWSVQQARGSYQVRCTTELTTDANQANDRLTGSVSVNVHDVGCSHLLAPTGGVDSNSAVTPACSLYNYGSGAENYSVRMRIGAFYNQTASVTSHASGTRIYVTFPAWSVQQARGSYQVRCTTEFTTDANHANDRQTGTVQVNVHDVACSHLLAPTGGVDSAGSVTPACSLYNYGSGSGNYSVRMRIGAFYNQTASVTSHASGTRIYVTFPAWSVQQARGSYQVRCTTELTTDANHANDRQTGTVQVSVHDVAAVSIQSPAGVLAPGSVIPRATVHNYGSAPETFKAFIRIIGGAGWTDSLVLTLASGRDSVLNFRNWNATPGSFATRCSTFLAADADHRNDTVSNTFLVIGHDIAAVSIEAPSGAILPGPVTPRATVHNYGSVTETFKAFVRILGGTPWTDSLTLTLASGHDSLVGFSSWLAAPGNYATRCSTFLAADDNHANDTVSNSFLVLSPDVGVTAILAPRDTVFPGIILPSATVHNYSTETESFRVFFRISGAGSYFDSVAVTLAGGRDTILSFAGWSATPGTYATRCSTGLAIDVNHANDVLAGSFVVRPLILAGWTRMANILQNPKHKNVKDGGALAYATQTGNDSGFVFAFKGNNTYEFYRYNVVNEGWLTRDSIPAYNRNMKKKAVKKGSSLVMGGNGRLYATKGNNTYDYWEYAPGSGGLAGGWTQKADVPPGTKAMREGAGAVAVQSAGRDTNYIYLLKGSGTYEFYRYSVEGNTWATLASAPAGASGKSFKNGSGLTYDGGDTIFCVKGSYNEFFAYSISGRNWTTRETLPRIAPPGSRKTKVKDGSGLAYDRRVIYALKGGNTNEFWTYYCDAHHWYVGDPMPTFSKKVKGGGALTFGSGRSWAFRGNNTLEFWQYKSPLGDLMPLAQSPQGEGAQSSSGFTSPQFALNIAPNPFASLAQVSYSLPVAGDVSLKLYDVTGKLVKTLVQGHTTAGSHMTGISAGKLANGIYVLKYENESRTLTSKLIIE